MCKETYYNVVVLCLLRSLRCQPCPTFASGSCMPISFTKVEVVFPHHLRRSSLSISISLASLSLSLSIYIYIYNLLQYSSTVYLEKLEVAFRSHLRMWRWHPHLSKEGGGGSPTSLKKMPMASPSHLRWRWHPHVV